MSGLIIEDNKRSLVLRSSSLFVNINGFVASTLARLCYFNQFDHEAEAVFVYNDNETFITDFRATIGQRKVHREIRELLNEKETERCCVQDQTDLVISIGKIPPNALVLLEVDVLGELQTTDNGQALVFKTPQIFTPFHSEFSEACSTTQAYTFDIKIRTDMPCQLAGCHSPSHAIQVDADANATSAETVIITLAEEFRYDRQIKVYFYPAKPLDVYTSIEPGIGTVQEINSSPKNTRYSMVNANPQTFTDSLHKTIERKVSFIRNEILNPKAKEHKEVLISDSITQHPSKDFSNNTINENIIHKRSSDRLVSDSNTSSEHVLRDESCVKEHSSKLKHNVCPEDYRNNEAKATSCLTEDSKYLFTNSTNEEMDGKYVSCQADSNSYQTDSTFHVLKNSTSVNLFLEEENLHDIKPQENYTTQRFMRRNSPGKDGSGHSYLKEGFTDNLNNSTTINSVSKDRQDPLPFKENFESNGKDIVLDDLVDSSCNTTSSSSGKVQDRASISCVWSKELLKYPQKVDVTNSVENTGSVNRCLVENNNLNSKSSNHARSRHFLSDSIIAASFLPDVSNYSVCGEYIFMLDRSGSMNGSHICNAKESLVLFLKSLPTSSYFNVVSFGSYSRSLFPCSQRYTQDSLEKGCVYVNSIKADMGGSELLQPLKAVLEKPHKAGYMRNVFVLTDGDIAQPDAILRYLKTKRHKARSGCITVNDTLVKKAHKNEDGSFVFNASNKMNDYWDHSNWPKAVVISLIFTFGIGPKISYNTVCNIARSGQGKAYFSEPGSKVQTKVIQCLKEVLKPTLCEVKVDWQLPTNWQLLRATPEIPFSLSDQRINLYALVQLPSRAQSREKSSSVKEFWFDEELDSCQLGDNMFFEDFQDNGEFSGYWGTDTDISTSDCEQQYDEKVGSDREYYVGNDRNDIVPDLVADEMKDGDNEELNFEESGDKFEGTEKIGTDQSNVEDIVKNWREVRNIRLYSSDTSTETEDECQADCSGNQWNISESHYNNPLDIQNSRSMSLPEKDLSQRNYDLNQNHHYHINSVTTYGGMETSDDVINNLAHVTDMSTDDSEGMMDNNIDVSTTKTRISPLDASDDSRHLSNNAMCNDVTHNDVIYNDDVIHNDVIHNDVKSVYITDNSKQADCIRQNEVYIRNCNVLSNDMNNTACGNKKNVIDCNNLENIPCSNYDIDDGINESAELTKDKTDSDWGSVLITGYIGPDIHRERIPLCLSLNTSKGISLHQMAAKKFIDGLEAILDSTPDSSRVEREIVTLSKESRVPSSMTSSTTINDRGNMIGVSQDSLGLTLRRRKQQPRNSPKLTRGDNPPAILVSCPSVDKESQSPTKRRLGMSTEGDAISDDGKYYRIERLDPEGCDQVKRETRRKRLVDCRNIPVTAIHRRKIVSTRLTLLTRKMRNAHKLNVFAGPPFIRLILLQSAEGFWQLTYAFARIIGLPLVQLELAAPFVDSTMIPLAEQDDRLGIDCYYDSLALWATALALVYLKRKWTSHEEDWELIAIKAEAWLQRQTFPQGFGYIDVMLAAKQAIVLLEQKYRSRAKSEPVGLIE